jgi:hypothetical protein
VKSIVASSKNPKERNSILMKGNPEMNGSSETLMMESGNNEKQAERDWIDDEFYTEDGGEG